MLFLSKLNQTELNALKQAYKIIDMFNDMITEEVIPKLNILFMSDDYQDLNTACAHIGGIIEKQEPAQIYKQLLVTTKETRDALTNAYEACHLVCENIRDDSDLSHAVAYLKSCFYIILNATYTTDTEIQDRMGNMFEICDHGLEALDTIEAISDNDCDEAYLNKSGQRIHERISQLKETFQMLRPKMSENDINNIQGDNKHEENKNKKTN